MQVKGPILFIFFLLLCRQASAQDAEKIPVQKMQLWQAFAQGTAGGELRYFFMATNNSGPLSDYYANAVGGYLRYETALFHHLQAAAGGSFTYNIGSSDLSKSDPVSGQSNRYETGLFDLQDPANKYNMYRLEELYLRYAFKAGSVTWGKQILNTPFINTRGTRMRPTVEDGVYGKLNIKKLSFEGGWLYGISPRSTMKWYSVPSSIGIYSTGLNPDGTKSGYKNNLESAGIGLLGITERSETNRIEIWDQYVAHIFNTLMGRIYSERPLDEKNNKLLLGFMCLVQHPANNGGNYIPDKAYFPPGTGSLAFSGRLGWKDKHWEASANYTRITKTGRFLMPREWGREPFFTAVQRERNEGFGDVHAFVLKAAYRAFNEHLQAELSWGRNLLPDVKNYVLNKYGLPSYDQVNANIKYTLGGALKGLESELLLVYKQKQGNTYGDYKYVFDKVDMGQVNLMISYLF